MTSSPPLSRTSPKSPKSPKRRAEHNVLSVVLGDILIKPWFPSFYPRDLVGSKVERLHVCPWCFRYTEEAKAHVIHMKLCPMKDGSPPGALIYDTGPITMHQVDGEQDKLYAQNLSLFAKLFLDTKSVFFDVTTFRYYVLTQLDESNARRQVVGFFSKEKMSWDNNNLACILVFPPWQRRGLGQMLMSVSYELSRRDGKLGGPEKPLSSLGRKSYLAYWSASIARWVSQKHTKSFSVQDIVRGTWILPEDVVATLEAMDVIEPSPMAPDEAFIVTEKVLAYIDRAKISLTPAIDTKRFIDTRHRR